MSKKIAKFASIRKRNTIESVVALTEARMWPKWDRESSLLLGAFITSSELPSKMNLEKPSSWAKDIALTAAKASTKSEEKGSWICSEREAIACPWSLRIITPKLALSISVNVVPSKLTLRELLGGGIHETRLEVDTKPRTGEQCSHGGNQIELAESFGLPVRWDNPYCSLLFDYCKTI